MLPSPNNIDAIEGAEVAVGRSHRANTKGFALIVDDPDATGRHVSPLDALRHCGDPSGSYPTVYRSRIPCRASGRGGERLREGRLRRTLPSAWALDTDLSIPPRATKADLMRPWKGTYWAKRS